MIVNSLIYKTLIKLIRISIYISINICHITAILRLIYPGFYCSLSMSCQNISDRILGIPYLYCMKESFKKWNAYISTMWMWINDVTFEEISRLQSL